MCAWLCCLTVKWSVTLQARHLQRYQLPGVLSLSHHTFSSLPFSSDEWMFIFNSLKTKSCEEPDGAHELWREPVNTRVLAGRCASIYTHTRLQQANRACSPFPTVITPRSFGFVLLKRGLSTWQTAPWELERMSLHGCLLGGAKQEKGAS